MTFAGGARWARCRAAHLCPWARQVNLNLQFSRTMASATALRLCGEGKPLAGFVEQRGCIQFPGLPALLGEVVDEMEETAAAQIAEIMNSLTLVDMMSGCSSSWRPMLSLIGTFNDRGSSSSR
uniref:Uncharacterized protein n=1 Tax=Noctiluca scintillans TaxID=2966 RepID=A0A7S1ABU3_NOCSC|mmetsp:Transcript_39959/g.106033  ORF Transcript_39959/g.106033 Transcript_39959/m.106033 type:complete len:123 (+) Transcript_39959:60-428(+)